MEIIQLVYVQWLSHEREKYIWEDLYAHSWDEIIGRMYLLKAHQSIERCYYQDALMDFEQALSLLAKDGVRRSRGYYARALADKALVQCFLAQYDTHLRRLIRHSLWLTNLTVMICSIIVEQILSWLVPSQRR